jgi:putative glycosyltransferase (TIGR04372 family)
MYRLVNWVFDRINEISPVIIQTPQPRSFGNGAEEMFYGLIRARREKKKVVFLYPRPRLLGRGFSIANKELYGLQSEYFHSNQGLVGLIGGYFLSAYLLFLYLLYFVRHSRRIRRILQVALPSIPIEATPDSGYLAPELGKRSLWKPVGRDSFSWKVWDDQNWQQYYQDFSPPHLSPHKRRDAERTRVRMGIPLGDWFVCLHVSESDPPMARNASILNYLEAMESITAAGGWVVRLGGPGMTALPTMERVIDYSHSSYRSELMDLYWIEQCRFFVGLTSGPNVVANLLKKPMVLVNLSEWSLGFVLKKGDLGILRHTFSRSRNRFLSVSEILKEPFEVQTYKDPGDDYVVIENTSEEIRQVIEEFMAQQELFEYSSLQVEFNAARQRQIREWIGQGEPRTWRGVPSRDIPFQQYRLAALTNVEGTLGHKYLEQNWAKDGLDESIVTAS